MLFYYKQQPNGKYMKVIVDNKYAGTKDDPYRVVDAYLISKSKHKKECKGKKPIYLK